MPFKVNAEFGTVRFVMSMPPVKVVVLAPAVSSVSAVTAPFIEELHSSTVVPPLPMTPSMLPLIVSEPISSVEPAAAEKLPALVPPP